MSYIVISFNDGGYALWCEFEEMFRVCGDFVGVEGNNLVWLMFHSCSCDWWMLLCRLTLILKFGINIVWGSFVSWNWAKWCLRVEWSDV